MFTLTISDHEQRHQVEINLSQNPPRFRTVGIEMRYGAGEGHDANVASFHCFLGHMLFLLVSYWLFALVYTFACHLERDRLAEEEESQFDLSNRVAINRFTRTVLRGDYMSGDTSMGGWNFLIYEVRSLHIAPVHAE